MKTIDNKDVLDFLRALGVPEHSYRVRLRLDPTSVRVDADCYEVDENGAKIPNALGTRVKSYHRKWVVPITRADD